MIREFKEMFYNDHIYTKNYKIKAFSFAWWVIRLSQVMAGIVGFYVFYCLIWLTFA